MKKFKLIVLGMVVLLGCNNSNTNTEQDTTIQVKQNPIDSSSVPAFEKTLSLQGINYKVLASGEGSIQLLTIVPSGLAGNNDSIKVEVDPVINAEIEDLDADGFPELLIYTQSAGSGSYGSVLGYSPNKGKSISPIYFPDINDNKKLSNGYSGHDEFAIVENSLVRRFKLYNDKDPNSKPSGKYRQIEYQLVNGEASKKFVVKRFQ